MRKEAITIISAMPITAGTSLAATAEIATILGKGAIVVIIVMPVTAGTLLVITAETAATLRTRSD